MNMKKAFIVISILFVSMTGWAQLTLKKSNVEFTYDASGNRITRSIVIKPKHSIRKNKSSATSEFADLLDERKVTITPNPTEGHLKVMISGKSETDKCSLSIYSANGQLIINNLDAGECTELDLSSHPNGYYILRIRINSETSSWKIIKK